MYGPMSPLTKAIGIRAAITVKVANTVGFPTSSVALTIASLGVFASFSSNHLCMFSTTTIASSTSIPMANMRANSVTLFRVKPYISLKKRAMARVMGTATPTTAASLMPRATAISSITEKVAIKRCSKSSSAFSFAVSP
ncbi:hypothetical protein HRbin13_00698 [bacterium HR13]|nr:hypothetical protein HRbin13_00698 [bacterium HR13]